ncbi:MAG: aminopeptidase [Proteobacteria bacterium]|nr:aminopeptidase [Pseudomonadota bacterium]
MAQTSKKDPNKALKDKLFMIKKSVWDGISPKTTKEIFDLGEEYKGFLNNCKTEREAVGLLEKWSSGQGYKNIDKAAKKDKKLFINNRGVSAVIANINNMNFEKGFHIIASHIDSPQLDLKGSTLYEADDMAFMKTHYYGGIKKYQWVEQLNILVGSIPYKFKSENDSIKLSIMDHLYKKYDIREEDFVSAEIHLVPAGKARDVGFDRSLIGAHGQDDRICAFAGAKALFDMERTNKNIMAVFLDKEEIGSLSDAGADSNLMIRIFTKIMGHYGVDDPNLVIKTMENSKVICADVINGIDPEWRNTIDPMNAAKMGCGVTINKYGGARGKSGASETHAEFVQNIRRAFAKDKVKWQVAELGKVDFGGGGTVAMFFAYYGMDVIDCGPALLSMHSTFEVASKADLYSTYQAYKAFYRHC